MKRWFNIATYKLAYGFWYVVSLLPFCVLYVLSDFFYFLLAHVIRYRQRVIWKNLTESFPDKSESELKQIKKDFYHWFCDYIVETLKLMSMTPEQLQRRMQFKNTEKIIELLRQEKSCAIYLGHYCNWEWITSLPYWVPKNVQCCQLYHPLENEAFDRLFKNVRERQHAVCVPMQESLRKILAFKKQKQSIIIGYIADQVPLWWNIHHWVDFLHHDTPVLTGAERIARRTDQACFYGDLRRVKRGYYTCEFIPIELEPAATKEFEITDTYFHLLEQTILREPALWLWSHNRWKRTREEFNRDWEEVGGKVVRKEKNRP
ncbi:MAG: lysophospholipid acyltransferase family protein [Prevotella sp.]|nr:lysophospholipid acyltransferase family protein [Prevotella sp.]MDY4218427.1 lysophospholipid acyltransferase family protein [Prevotella sp.]